MQANRIVKKVVGGLSWLVGDPAPDPPAEESSLFWGMRHLPFSDAAQRFLVVGSPGSGKTTLLNLLMRSAMRQVIKEKSKHRALVYDAKRDMLPLLAKMGLRLSERDGLPAEVRTLNPFDLRGYAWDIAEDVTSPAAALQVATILIPQEKDTSQPYFSDAARHLLYGVMLSFMEEAPLKWTLRQVLLVLKSTARLKAVLTDCQYTQDIAKLYFKGAQSFDDVMTTLATKLLPLEIVAALWDRAAGEGRKLSLRSWIDGRFVLVLGSHPSNQAALQSVNQAIFRRLTDLLLTLPEETDHGVDGRRTWLFLDEVREAGKLDGLSSLLNQGRSKGVSTVLGFQDIEGLREAYGASIAHEIVGQCDNKTFLRTESQVTAEWAEKHFGQSLQREYTGGASERPDGREDTRSRSVGEHIQQRPVVLYSTFMDLPRTSVANGITGYHDVPTVGAYRDHLGWEKIEKLRQPLRKVVPSPDDLQGEISCATDRQYLAPWSEADAKSFGVTQPISSSEAATAKDEPPDNPPLPERTRRY